MELDEISQLEKYAENGDEQAQLSLGRHYLQLAQVGDSASGASDGTDSNAKLASAYQGVAEGKCTGDAVFARMPVQTAR